jgi:PKD repeat protein
MLRPVDLVYVCGNKFLATNGTRLPITVTYRVAGTDESGSLTLREGAGEDPGFSETELETTEHGTVELYLEESVVARRRNQGVPCGAPRPSFSVAAGASVEAGEWSEPFPWPLIAIHQSLLSNGKVLSFGAGGTPAVWDPATGHFTQVPLAANPFCSGHSFLANGELLVAGGHISTDRGHAGMNIFSTEAQSWTPLAPMRRGRWYPTNTTLGNGDVVILAGRDEAGVVVGEPEVWGPGGLRVLSGASRALPYYPRAFLAPNGQVFYAGEQQTSRYLNPSGSGSWTTVGDRLYGTRDYGAAVMYDDGKILYVGGGRTTNTAEIIDLNSAPVWQWTGSMAFPRRHLNATVLPTGEVLVTGGSSGPGFNDFNLAVHAAEIWNPTTGTWRTLASNVVNRTYHSTSILLPDGRVLNSGSGDTEGAPIQKNAELFSPPYLFKGPRPSLTETPSLVGYGTQFTVTTPQASDIARVSLIRLGSTTHAFDMNQRLLWLSFTRQAEALSIAAPTSPNRAPPGHYMLFILNGNGVPSVARIVRLGENGPGPPPPSLIILSATGRVDGTAQIMSLKWSGARGTTVDIYRNGAFLRNTANDGSDTNGRTYQGAATYVFKVCEAGTSVCSNLATVEFGGGTPNAAPVANFTSSCTGLTCSFTDGSTDGDGTVVAWSWSFGDGGSSTARNPSRTYGSAGTYPVTLTVTDDDGATNQRSTSVAVTGATTASAITLTATGTATTTTQTMSLKWKGAQGTTVDIYRNGLFLRNTTNDGSDSNGRTYSGAATYKFKVCEKGSTTCSNLATVLFNGGAATQNVVPKAVFASSCVNLSCTFTDASVDWDGSLGQWQWSFGDGGSSTSQSPSHAYPASGTYSVKLVVTDNNNATGTVSQATTVTAPTPANQSPVATFTWSCTGLTCTFTDASTDDDGVVTAWSWDFGDGISSTEPSPSHDYASAGEYQVTLTVTDDDTATGSLTQAVGPTATAAATAVPAGR